MTVSTSTPPPDAAASSFLAERLALLCPPAEARIALALLAPLLTPGISTVRLSAVLRLFEVPAGEDLPRTALAAALLSRDAGKIPPDPLARDLAVLISGGIPGVSPGAPSPTRLAACWLRLERFRHAAGLAAPKDSGLAAAVWSLFLAQAAPQTDAALFARAQGHLAFRDSAWRRIAAGRRSVDFNPPLFCGRAALQPQGEPPSAIEPWLFLSPWGESLAARFGAHLNVIRGDCARTAGDEFAASPVPVLGHWIRLPSVLTTAARRRFLSLFGAVERTVAQRPDRLRFYGVHEGRRLAGLFIPLTLCPQPAALWSDLLVTTQVLVSASDRGTDRADDIARYAVWRWDAVGKRRVPGFLFVLFDSPRPPPTLELQEARLTLETAFAAEEAARTSFAVKLSDQRTFPRSLAAPYTDAALKTLGEVFPPTLAARLGTLSQFEIAKYAVEHLKNARENAS